MNRRNLRTHNAHARLVTVLCAALVSTGAMAANPKLQIVDVTPTAKTISVGQKQAFTATGTFSNGSRRVLGPAISNFGLGSGTTCALQSSGGVECWGYNHGLLGNGTWYDSLKPSAVKGISTASAVALGGSHGCALLGSGEIQCWGYNTSGELGNGGNQNSNVPVPVTGISTATALALGDQSCALLVNGAIKCWGSNIHGQLGDGSNANRSVPVSVNGISTATAISGSYAHVCALLASRTVQCWGYNFYGQLGDGTTTDSNVPVKVAGIAAATAIAAGLESSCAVLAAGTVRCWGDNRFGQLGNGSNASSATPVPVTGINTAVAITPGAHHYCVLLRSGSVQCWGANALGQLGNGTRTTSTNVPVTVSGISSPTALAAGSTYSCALFSGGMMECWGADNYGQLGNQKKTSTGYPLPVTVVGTPGVIWKSSNAGHATITDRGVATGTAAGNTTITASTPGLINDNAVLTVQ